jgi:hypothetical protein
MELEMNKFEKAALEHVAAELKYQRSTQAAADRIKDMDRRARADRKLGHSPKCTLTKCHPECMRVQT